MKKGLFIFFLITTLFSATSFADKFYSCSSKYALCTSARCTPVPGKKDTVSCDCKVLTGYSAATQECKAPEETKEGELVYSRYYPVKSVSTCTNSRPWAWCLDKPCIIDKKNPSRASCACSLVSDLGPYVIVPSKYSRNACTSGITSSATVDQITDITNFIKTQKHPEHIPLKFVKHT